MKRFNLVLALIFAASPAFCQEDPNDILAPGSANSSLVIEAPVFNNNLGALGAGDTTADIASEDGSSATGTAAGEITIRKIDAGVEVFSGLNKVETIVTNSDGWIGSVVLNSSEILFTPAGRPELRCPAQDLPNWFGPCKLTEG